MGRKPIYTDANQRARVNNAVKRLLVKPSKPVIVRRGKEEVDHIVRRLAEQGHTANVKQVGEAWAVWVESEKEGK
jgi:hypothetical protein